MTPAILSLSLSGALCKRWKRTDWPKLPAEAIEPVFRWRLDVLPLGRTRCHLLCVNEVSLYSFVLLDIKPFTEHNGLQAFVDRLQAELRALDFDAMVIDRVRNAHLLLGKNTDRSLLGSVNDIKYHYQCQLSIDSPSVAEQKANRMPMSMLDYRYASEKMEGLR